MIRTLGVVIVILLVLHLLAAGLFVGWLGWSGRLNSDRIDRMIAVFEPTIEEERRLEAEAAEQEAKALEIARQAARLSAVSSGPRTLQQRLAEQQVRDEIAEARLDRIKRETEDLRRRLENDKLLITRLKGELDAERAAFAAHIQAEAAQAVDEDFVKTVEMFEQLKAKQAKTMVQNMIARGEVDEAVELLTAMNLRKAGAILREFKAEAELVQAALLLERLRDRGIDLAGRGVGTVNGGAS